MCGRFTLSHPKLVNRDFDSLVFPEGLAADFRPTNLIPVILKQDGQIHLDFFQWGIYPPWDDRKLIFNARNETIFQKPIFRHLYQNKNICLIPCDGFYEKTHYFQSIPGKLYYLTGLYDPDDHTAVIITTAADSIVGKYHDRMPLLSSPQKLLKL